MRRKTRPVKVGNLIIGGDAPISVQSMTTTKTSNVKATVAQIKELERAGCEIIRVAVPDMDSARSLKAIKEQIDIPLVADIHFDYRLALAALEGGADKLRINPGNIGSQERVKAVVKMAKEKRVPIRIGVNAGSLHKKYLPKKHQNLADALVESALEHVRILENLDFFDIVLSVKSSSVLTTIKAYRELAELVDYPFHLGITEAGTLISGTVKSAVGMGILLSEGLGDTVRVSLSANPVEEIRVAYKILSALGLRQYGPEVIACPTCGRCEIDLIPLAEDVEKRLLAYLSSLKVAVMGCVVNGPGEAKEADIGIAGGKKQGLLFSRGKIIKKLPQEELVEALMEEVRRLSEVQSPKSNVRDQ